MNHPSVGTSRIAPILCLGTWVLLAGCGETPPEPPPDRDIWEVFRIQGSRSGYSHTTIRTQEESGGKVVRVESLQSLTVNRAGQPTELTTQLTSVETLDGRLLRFENEMKLGPGATKTVGRVVGERLELEMSSPGKNETSSIPWSDEYGGPFAPQQSLWAKPMQPGQQRTLEAVDPLIAQVATFELTAKDYESVELLAGSDRLLRIDATQRFPDGQEIQITLWTDRSGDVLKTHGKAMDLETVRATKSAALAKPQLPDVDIITDTLVKLDRPLTGAHRTKRVRYRVHLADGNPAELFVSGPSQAVKSIDPHTAEITVHAIRGGQDSDQAGGNPDAPDDPPTADDRRPNNMIQSDHARIVADARRGAGDRTEPWKVALALERYAHAELAAKNFSFSTGFATAAEVAESREGDCSENAVFLAALARARGIPARVALGLVYVPHQQAFGYHMWTEAYVHERWVPLDATLGQGGIGAAHLKLTHSNLQGSNAYLSFLPVAKVIGGLSVEVLEVE